MQRLEVDNDDAAVRVLLFDCPHDVGFADVGSDSDSRRQLGAVGPDRDRPVGVAIQDGHCGAGVCQLRPEDH
jgi:hypothetical protein